MNEIGHRTTPRLVAVIDIGATSVRMSIAQVKADGSIAPLDFFTQSVALARDSFVLGELRQDTIEDCVHVLTEYRKVLNQLGITEPSDIRVVATSAVREADNRLAFLDRVMIATGFSIEPFDESRLHRVTYLGIQPLLKADEELATGETLICEVGGGSTETLILADGLIRTAKTWRLGALRLIYQMESVDRLSTRSRHLLESRIRTTVNKLSSFVDSTNDVGLVVMGSEMRLVAKQVHGENVPDPAEVSCSELESFVNDVIRLSPDQLVTRFQLSLPEAESLAAALLINLGVAKAVGAERMKVAHVSLRDGLINEMTTERRWVGLTADQVAASAIALGRRFGIDEVHALHVAELAIDLFRQTAPLHQLSDRWEIVLRTAAILHEVGLAINERGYHKHSMYIIANSVLFGIGAEELTLISLVARYHRRALPQLSHQGYATLNQKDRVVVSKLSAILRVAKALDVGRNQMIHEIRATPRGNSLLIEIPGSTDLSLEQLEIRRQQDLFQYVFGRQIDLAYAPQSPRDR